MYYIQFHNYILRFSAPPWDGDAGNGYAYLNRQARDRKWSQNPYHYNKSYHGRRHIAALQIALLYPELL